MGLVKKINIFLKTYSIEKQAPLPVVHSISRFIVRINRVLITNLLGSLSLLIHVCPTHQFGGELPALTAR